MMDTLALIAGVLAIGLVIGQHLARQEHHQPPPLSLSPDVQALLRVASQVSDMQQRSLEVFTNRDGSVQLVHPREP